jgi:hypothetical protein
VNVYAKIRENYMFWNYFQSDFFHNMKNWIFMIIFAKMKNEDLVSALGVGGRGAKPDRRGIRS